MDETADLELAFERAALDIRRVIHAIAGRYLARGLPLTWRLLHDIENEALADLGLASRHDAGLLNLFLRLADSGSPDSDEPVRISSTRQVPLITWFALDVYGVGSSAGGRERNPRAPLRQSGLTGVRRFSRDTVSLTGPS